MNIHSIRRVAAVAVLAGLVLAPGGSAKGKPIACPDSDLQPCFEIAIVPKDQRVRLAPRVGFDGRGNQIWRAGNHLMQ